MASAVLHINYDIPGEELVDRLGTETRFVHVHLTPDPPSDLNLIRLARREPSAKRTLVELTNRGFHAYITKDGVTRFARYTLLGDLWLKVRDGEYEITDDGIVYSFTPPPGNVDASKLLVVFSSIHEDMYTSSLMRHFMQNFPSVQKYLSYDTAILRISDLGGVAGSFYLNSTYLPNNVENIQNLLTATIKKYGVGRDSIVLYGVSKGGTGALYHGLTGGYRCVAVDPIVSDRHYEEEFDDLHFTSSGTFPRSKQEVFKELVEKVALSTPVAPMPYSRWAVICSDRSPQFPYISAILMQVLMDYVAFFNSKNPLIKDHPDVGPRTVNTATMLMNMQLYGLPLRAGLTTID